MRALRMSLSENRFLLFRDMRAFAHVLIGKPVPTFPGHAMHAFSTGMVGSAHARMEIPVIAASRRLRPQYLPREGNCTDARSVEAEGYSGPTPGGKIRGEA